VALPSVRYMAKGIAPQRRFSQNFLTDVRVAQRIVSELTITPDDTVIEIGPGTGALTKWLAASPAKRIIAIDADERAIEHCSRQPWVTSRCLFIQADVRQVNLADLLSGEKAVLVGNLPYNITSELVFWILDNQEYLTRAVIMVQLEVARRLVAPEGSKEYGILSVAVRQGAKPNLLFTVKPGSFFPAPSVQSAVVRFLLHPHPLPDSLIPGFREFVRAAFSMRRKLASNTLKHWLAIQNIKQDIQLDVIKEFKLSERRPETISPADYIKIFCRLVGVSLNT